MGNREFLLNEIAPKGEITGSEDVLLYISSDRSIQFVNGKVVDSPKEREKYQKKKANKKITISYGSTFTDSNWSNEEWEEWYKRREEAKKALASNQ